MAIEIVASSPRQWGEQNKLGYIDVVDVAGGCWRDCEGGFGRTMIISDEFHESLRAKQRIFLEDWRSGRTRLPQTAPQPIDCCVAYPSMPWVYQGLPAKPPPPPFSTQNLLRGAAERFYPPNQTASTYSTQPAARYTPRQPSPFRLVSAATWQHTNSGPQTGIGHRHQESSRRDDAAPAAARDGAVNHEVDGVDTGFANRNPFRRHNMTWESSNAYTATRGFDVPNDFTSSTDQDPAINTTLYPLFSLRARSQTEAPRSIGHENSVYDSDDGDEDEVRLERRIPGFLWPENQEPISVLAYPDDGAHLNSMTLKFAKDNNFYVRTEPEYRRKVRKPDGVHLVSIGQTYSEFIFSREPGNVHREWFAVFDVDSRMGDVILGLDFLTRTHTLDSNSHRIAEVEVTQKGEHIRRSHGSSAVAQKRLHGYLDGEMVEAMPDGGSVVYLMSEAYARRRGFTIKEISSHDISVEFYDGSTQQVTGEVNAKWKFEDDPSAPPIVLKFRVYSLFPHQVLLGQPLLYNTALRQSAYVEHAASFHSTENPDGIFDLGPIMWSRKKASKAAISPPPQTTSVRERSDEMHRRITAEKEYMKLTGLARRDAEEQEGRRRQEWERVHPPR